MKEVKNVDGISATEPKIITGKAQYKANQDKIDAPLLNIIEPAKESPKNIVVPKKTSFLFKNVADLKPKKEKSAPKTDKPSVLSHLLATKSKTETLIAKKPVSKSKTKIEDKSTEKDSFIRKHRKAIFIISIIFGSVLLLLALIGGTAYAHQALYENKIFPGVVVWGEEVGGKSTTEVQKIISNKINNYKVVIKGPDQDYTARAADLGISFNSESMALSAYSKGRTDNWSDDFLVRARLMMTSVKWSPLQKVIRAGDLSIPPSYEVNDLKLTAYLNTISNNIKIDPQDSVVTVTGSSTQLKPAIYGRKVDFEGLKNSVKGSIGSFEYRKIEVKTTSIAPAIVDNSAQEVMLQAQNVMQRPVVLSYQGTDYRPNQETVASWITFNKNPGEAKYTLTIDQGKMYSYFSFLKSKIDIPYTERIVRVENTVKSTETQAGKDGLLVDTALLGSQIAQALPNQPSVNLTIPTYVDAFKTKYDNVIIADWDKYIDVNLTTQVMTACERGGVNCHQWSVTTGNDSHATPTGTFLVLGRNASFYMTGGTPGVDYYKVWVDHAVWFTSAGHAIHDAHWRNGSFGGQDYHWNGSHGCVNSPDDAAIFIYNWAPVGTPVIVHY